MSYLSKKEYKIAVLQLESKSRYRENLDTLIGAIESNRDKDLIVAPEVYLTGYDYDKFEESYSFYDEAIEALTAVVSNQIFIFTIVRREGEKIFNQATVIHNHRVVYRQNKYRLFKIGNEHRYFTAGDVEDILPFTIDGVKYAIIICFELRFKELWRRVEGVDIVVIPAMWGRARQRHLEALSEALAVMNQSFVVVANSANSDMAKSSSITSPWGDRVKNNRLKIITNVIDLKEVKKVRRLIYMR